MDIIYFTDKFQEIEIENDFFNEIDENGICYWDLVRHDVFYLIYNDISNLERLKQIEKKKLLGKELLKIINILWGYLIFNYKIYFNKYKYILFIASRNKTKEGQAIDLISKDIIYAITESKLIIESVNENNRNNFFPKILDYKLLLKVRIGHFFNKILIKKQKTYTIATILTKEFNCTLDLNAEITSRIINHKIQLKHYLNLFQKTKPKAIFVVQNGICKAIFEAANKLSIRAIELQHGYIGYVHPAYSYPKSINPGDLNTLPSDFFSFSDFWTSKLNFPVKQIFPIGNSYNSNKPLQIKKEYDLTFIFADVYTNIFLPIIDDLLNKEYDGTICIKLHPNQLQDVVSITYKFSKNSNVIVLTNEYSMSEVLNKSKAIVGIQSTSLYEAIHIGGIKIYVLKRNDYRLHKDIFEFNNVFLIDNADEILDNTECSSYSINNENMFDTFNIHVFNQFMSNLK